ncbi:toll/interleukin-1 receptor domain-containing protein [Reticulibacter mediterranei]|nr:TIR domain-containing protein [Reticulibacter mediterranei]
MLLFALHNKNMRNGDQEEHHSKNSIHIFYAYAHEDEALRKALETHLSALKHQGLITDWFDRNITAGEQWITQTQTHLQVADIILLLISPSFFASEYCSSFEMKQAIQRHEEQYARVIPIILRPVDWKHTILSHLQALPENAKPITQWRNRDHAFLSVATSIRKIIEDIQKKPAFPSLSSSSSFAGEKTQQYASFRSFSPFFMQQHVAELVEGEAFQQKKVSSEIGKKATDTYKIILLGASGAGKTTLLSSMYNALAVQRPNTSFFLETTPDQRKKLNAMYYGIVSGQWPPGTQVSETEEWHFTCRVRSPGKRIYSPFHCSYLDYAGGRITERMEDMAVADNFEQQFAQSHALLGLLDGQKLLALMQKKQEADHFIYIELQNMLQIMQNGGKLAHFFITKWDLLQAKYSLQDIRDRLLQIDEFNHFVRNQSNSYCVRLIPVSAVGAGFAELQGDGSIRKVSGSYPKPFHIDLPLCCIWSDLFHAGSQSLWAYSEQERGLGAIHDKKTAQRAVIQSCLQSMHTLEEAFPVSRFL